MLRIMRLRNSKAALFSRVPSTAPWLKLGRKLICRESSLQEAFPCLPEIAPGCRIGTLPSLHAHILTRKPLAADGNTSVKDAQRAGGSLRELAPNTRKAYERLIYVSCLL